MSEMDQYPPQEQVTPSAPMPITPVPNVPLPSTPAISQDPTRYGHPLYNQPPNSQSLYDQPPDNQSFYSQPFINQALTSRRLTLTHGLILAGAIVFLVGSFLPWHVTEIRFGVLFDTKSTENAWAFWSSIAATFAALIVVLIVFLRFFFKSAIDAFLLSDRWSASLFGALALVGSIFAEVQSPIGQLQGVSTTFGYGAFISAAGAVAMIIGGILTSN